MHPRWSQAKRYEPERYDEDRVRMELDSDGDWVRYSDYLAACATPQVAAQPEPYGYHSPKTGKVYASTEAASMAMAGEVKTVYLAQPERAPLTDAEIEQILDPYHGVPEEDMDYYEFVRSVETYIKQGEQHD